MKISRNLIESIVSGKCLATEEVKEVAAKIIDKNLFDSFADYATQVGVSSDLDDIQNVILDYSWDGAKISVDVSETSYPGGKLEFYGMTPADTFRNMMEAIDDNPEIMDLLAGKVLQTRGVDKKYMLVQQDGQRYLTEVDK